MAAPTNVIKAIPLISINAAALTVNYQSMNPAGLPAACVMLFINNFSNVSITLSYDGVTDNEFLLPDSARPLYFQASSAPNNQVAMMPQGTEIFIKSTGAGVGSVVISAYYL